MDKRLDPNQLSILRDIRDGRAHKINVDEDEVALAELTDRNLIEPDPDAPGPRMTNLGKLLLSLFQEIRK